MIYSCCNDRRRVAVQAHSTLNGIDFVEIQDNPSDPDLLRQRTLYVHFLKDLPASSLNAANIRIEGGERIQNIKVVDAFIGAVLASTTSPPSEGQNVLVVDVSEPGDFSTYTLRLVDVGPALPLDPLLSSVDFSFKVACPSDFDCMSTASCGPQAAGALTINYLAKDFASFRQLMLDRMAALVPEWTERNASDLGVVLVELMAYVGDYLSYQQDAIGTEAYLGVARKRTSIKRHARLIDYFVHEGASARTWIQIKVIEGISNVALKIPKDGFQTQFLTQASNAPVFLAPDSSAFQAALLTRPERFELASEVTLFSQHNNIQFYTWGAQACCLPQGATQATLRTWLPDLKPGDVLIFMEARGPLTGEPEDADPAHRCAVRLTSISKSSDPLGGQFQEPISDDAVEVTEIEWAPGDALPFPLCISARQGDSYFDDVSVALGNIVLVDHGTTISDELLPVVPAPNPVLSQFARPSGSFCTPVASAVTPARYRPSLKQSPLTHRAKYHLDDTPFVSAASIMAWPEETPQPQIKLVDDQGKDWNPQPDLLASGSLSRDFVVEVENDDTAWLRFGDDHFGERPRAGANLWATYRVGNGSAGNVGRETLAHLVSSDASLSSIVLRVWNPMAAAGGMDPESTEEVRQHAPSAFQVQERAVTQDDYADLLQRANLNVQRAAATFRWTGSWRTVFLVADRLGGQALDSDFAQDMRAAVEPYRMAGIDLDVEPPLAVSLEIAMTVCVNPAYFKGDVEAALAQVFSNRVAPDGQKGIFHPDNFTFGQAVYLSPIYAAAQSVDGVDSVVVTKFQRQREQNAGAIESGVIQLGKLEIARLDNDRNFPEHGLLTLTMEGGR